VCLLNSGTHNRWERACSAPRTSAQPSAGRNALGSMLLATLARTQKQWRQLKQVPGCRQGATLNDEPLYTKQAGHGTGKVLCWPTKGRAMRGAKGLRLVQAMLEQNRIGCRVPIHLHPAPTRASRRRQNRHAPDPTADRTYVSSHQRPSATLRQTSAGSARDACSLRCWQCRRNAEPPPHPPNSYLP
jgi:hypothetical protein